MQKLVKNYLDELNKRHKRNRRAAVALLLLAVLVIGGVLSTLSQYGVALEEPEKKPLCGLEEHTHTDACYEEVLICGHGEGAEEDAEAEPVAQEPTAQEPVERVLTCGQEESEGHTHSGDCYTVEETLICGQEESEGHTHGEGCYGEDGQLICGQEESEGHTHTGDCYEVKETLTCGQEESEGHTHTDACYTETVPEAVAPEETTKQESPAETEEEHIHTDACYERRLICGLEEHTHAEACYVDGAADVETASDWEQMFADVEWKEEWGQDLVTAAQMQIGYQESKTNYQSDEDGAHKGYTRYGAFMEDPYMDWNAAFVNFCLHYAGLNGEDVFPEDTNAGEWYQTFVEADENNADYITPAEEYEPKAGDIVFLEDEENGDTLMGIVSSYDEETGEAKVIAGDDGDEVTEETYVVKGEAADESPISSYLMTTELEDHIKNNIRIMKAEGEDYTVTVRFTDAAEIPEDAVLNVREIEEGTDEYQTHYEQSLEAMGAEELSFVRYFDITFLVNGEKIEPKDTVNVTINCADSIEAGEDDRLGVVHFKNDGEVEVLDVESNLNGDTAAVSEEGAGSDPEEETTGTFFRFDQNSFSVDGVAVMSEDGQPDQSIYDFYKCSANELSELDGKTFLLTNFSDNWDGNDRSRIMTGERLGGGKGMKGEAISRTAEELSKPLTDAWSFEKVETEEAEAETEEVDGKYYLYNAGWKKYLKMSDSSDDKEKVTLVKNKADASQLQVDVQNANIVISVEEDGAQFRLNNSGSAQEFAAYSSGNSKAAENEEITLFAETRTVVLSPYNTSGVSTGQGNAPYRFRIGTLGNRNNWSYNDTPGVRISFNVSNETVLLPDDTTRKSGFNISTTEKDNRRIADSTTSGTYKWKLKGWYNIATGDYYSVVDGPIEAKLSSDKKNVFYADWEAASYDFGTESSNNLGNALDTKSYDFIKTELFDYNELVNITLNKVNSNFGKKLAYNTDGSEKWEFPEGVNNNAAVAFGDWVLGDKSGNLGTSYANGNTNLEKEITNKTDVDKVVETLFDFEGADPMGITSLGRADCLYKEGTGTENGYYVYNSDENAASFNRRLGRFFVYPKTQLINANKDTTGSSESAVFAPFNGQESKYTQNVGAVNYWFGMKTEINYWLNNPSSQTLDPDNPANYVNGNPMQFEFTGDDDVWVFDEYTDEKGVEHRDLILNLSSCHYKWSGTINFSTGLVTGHNTSEYKNFTPGAHKLVVYYLERGAGLSNCKIKFNLVPAWEYEGTSVQKITVNKKWETATPSDAVVSVSLYESDEVGKKKPEAEAEETVPLSSDNNWTYTWYRTKGTNYTVEENETEEDSYIMVKSERNTDYWGSWIENSNLRDGDKIVIGNGKGSDTGMVLEVQDNGSLVAKKRDVITVDSKTSDVLRNEDDTETGITLNQQWIVHTVNSGNINNAYNQFQLESASQKGFYLSIKKADVPPSLVQGDDLGIDSPTVSTFYFEKGQLTGISMNQLVWKGEDFTVVSRENNGASTSSNDRVHLYKYFPVSKDNPEEVKSPSTDVTITNRPLTANLQIEKVNRASESGLALSGAEFELYRKENYPNGSVEKTITTGNGDKLGIADIGSLSIGTYYLKETKAPTGYALLTEPVVITVSKNINQNPAEGEAKASVKVDVDFQMSNAWANDTGIDNGKDETTGHLTYDAKTGTFTIVVPNVLLYELPSTGGIGTYWYTIGGTLLLIAAALVLYKRKYAGR